ncbi:MAG: PAS domain-containing protein, partial [Chloroflexota bacterium]|nr:PAS domain-containing protein [Chloroflexota bacterium]
MSAFATMRDVLTARSEESMRLSLVASHTDNAVIIADRQGRIEWVNSAFTEMCGYLPEDVIGRKPGHVLQGPGSDAETLGRIRAAIKNGVGFREELLNYRKDGTPYWVSLNTSPIRDESGTCIGFVGIERDVTDRRRAEEERGRMVAIIESSEDAIVGKA